MEQFNKESQNKKVDLEKLAFDIRVRVNKEKLVLTEVFKEETRKLERKSDILSLAIKVSPSAGANKGSGDLTEGLIIIYKAFNMTPEKFENEIEDFMSGEKWDIFSYKKLNIVEDLLGLKRDSLYSKFRND